MNEHKELLALKKCIIYNVF